MLQCKMNALNALTVESLSSSQAYWVFEKSLSLFMITLAVCLYLSSELPVAFFPLLTLLSLLSTAMHVVSTCTKCFFNCS